MPPVRAQRDEGEAARAGRDVSAVSVAWALTSSTAAIAVGLSTASAVLIAFGAIGYVDAIGSVALVVHFRHAVHHDAYNERLESLAHRVVLAGMATVGCAAVVGGVARAVGGDQSEPTAAAIVFTTASLVVSGVLAAIKRSVAGRTASAALASDAHVTAIGAVEALVALLGAAATSWLAWASADGVATGTVGLSAILLAATTWFRELRSTPTANPAGRPGAAPRRGSGRRA